MNPRRVDNEDKIAFVLVMDTINTSQLFIFTTSYIVLDYHFE